MPLKGFFIEHFFRSNAQYLSRSAVKNLPKAESQVTSDNRAQSAVDGDKLLFIKIVLFQAKKPLKHGSNVFLALLTLQGPSPAVRGS